MEPGGDRSPLVRFRTRGPHRGTLRGDEPDLGRRIQATDLETKPKVIEADPGRAFAFRMSRPSNSQWRYQFEATDSGTLVTESLDCPGTPAVPRLLQRRAGITDRADHLRRGMEQTLDALATTIEADRAARLPG